MLVVTSRIGIPMRELQFTFARSGGPGGQNVNKVNTKATLRWAVVATTSLPEAVHARFLARYRRRVTNEGDVVLTSQRFRDQSRNVADCLDKLRQMVAAVATAPARRIGTRPTRGSIERRLEGKRLQAGKKGSRRGVPDDRAHGC
jgi:ribosome-associated protein